MKKIILVVLVLVSSLGFSNCDAEAEKLLEKVIKEKMTKSKEDKLKYFDPTINGNKYEYTVFEDHDTHTVNRAFLTLDLSTGIVYKYNTADDSLVKIYQDKKSICKN